MLLSAWWKLLSGIPSFRAAARVFFPSSEANQARNVFFGGIAVSRTFDHPERKPGRLVIFPFGHPSARPNTAARAEKFQICLFPKTSPMLMLNLLMAKF